MTILRRIGLRFALAFALVHCASAADRFGYARTYHARGEELAHARRAHDELEPARVCRDPEHTHDARVGWFGVVRTIDAAPMAAGAGIDGWADATLDFRAHLEPHQCWRSDEASCRVTVSDAPGGVFRARIQLTADDWQGDERVRPGSLLKVYGPVMTDRCMAEGGPEIDVVYYRHWPRGQYATAWPGTAR